MAIFFVCLKAIEVDSLDHRKSYLDPLETLAHPFIHIKIIKGIEIEPPFFLWNSAGWYPA